MVLKSVLRFLIGGFKRLEQWSLDDEKTTYKTIKTVENDTVVASAWDFLQFVENTQAFHLTNSIGFEEWVDMQEIRRRIQEIFSVSYKNERSLYPYLKTLVDIGLVETSNIGGRRKWRKKGLLVDFAAKKQTEKTRIIAQQEI